MAIRNGTSTAAIILAAGTSSRMSGGQHKLLLPLAGRPVLVHVIAAALASQARPIIMVLGHQSAGVRAHIADFVRHPAMALVENPDYVQGMSTSLRLGLRVLMDYPERRREGSYSDKDVETLPDSALILLGDQPLITPGIIDTLIATWRSSAKSIIMPLYNGKRGNPALFSASFFPELLHVSGDEGGRSVIESYPEEVATVELGDAATAYDVDTWEAYQQVVEVWQSKQDAQ